MNIVAIIQARMGSTRLPGKSLLSLHGQAIIDWVVQRTALSQQLHHVVVATSTHASNDPLCYHLDHYNVPYFRGDEEDVLSRFYHAAMAYKATHIVRICADNPLIWGEEIDNLITAYLHQQSIGLCDYAYNHIPHNNRYPDGLGAEIVSFSLLEHLHATATKPRHREHCLSYMWDNPQQFSFHTFDPPDFRLHHPECKLDIDTEEDYRFLATLPLYLAIPPHEVIALCQNKS